MKKDRAYYEHQRHLGTMKELSNNKKELEKLKKENENLRKSPKVIELLKCEICKDFVGYKHLKGYKVNEGVLQKGQGVGQPLLSFCKKCRKGKKGEKR